LIKNLIKVISKTVTRGCNNTRHHYIWITSLHCPCCPYISVNNMTSPLRAFPCSARSNTSSAWLTSPHLAYMSTSALVKNTSDSIPPNHVSMRLHSQISLRHLPACWHHSRHHIPINPQTKLTEQPPSPQQCTRQERRFSSNRLWASSNRPDPP
jgi:hypothetical protein